MPSLRSPRDARLVDRIAAGDVDAWATVDSRYRPALRRYVGSLARPGTIDPDDVVQDALMRAFDRLRRGDGPDQLRPWLYRLCRNAAIDAIRARTRHRDDELSGNEAAAAATEPERTVLRRERLRRITADVAALPDRQRVALLARAVDGRPVGEIGAELGISNDAVHMTVQRARESLMRSEHARDADCEQIRVLLHDAHDRRVRPRETARLHLKSCAGCRAYREDLRRVDHQLRALAPPVLPLLAVLAAHAGLTTKGAAVGAGIATAGTVAVAVTGGLILVGGVQRRDAGEPAPFRLSGVRGYVDHRVVQGDPVPGRTSIVTARVRMPASPTSTRGGEFVTLRCPAGMIVGGLQAPINEHSDIRWNPNPPILERPSGRLGSSCGGRGTPGATRPRSGSSAGARTATARSWPTRGPPVPVSGPLTSASAARASGVLVPGCRPSTPSTDVRVASRPATARWTGPRSRSCARRATAAGRT